MIRRRTLAPGEAQKAIDAGGPLQELQIQAEKLTDMAIAVVETAEPASLPDWRIVAYWVTWYALHLEPLWIHADYRKNPAVVGGIVDQMREIAEQTGEGSAFCVIEAENLELVTGYATRLGFLEAPGKLFYVMLQQPALEPVEG